MQKLKTRVVRKNLNPEWNEDLTLSITDPIIPINLVSDIFLQVQLNYIQNWYYDLHVIMLKGNEVAFFTDYKEYTYKRSLTNKVFK